MYIYVYMYILHIYTYSHISMCMYNIVFWREKIGGFGDTLLVAHHCPMTVPDQFSSFKEFSQLKLLTQLHTLWWTILALTNYGGKGAEMKKVSKLDRCVQLC